MKTRFYTTMNEQVLLWRQDVNPENAIQQLYSALSNPSIAKARKQTVWTKCDQVSSVGGIGEAY